jgi:HK97 family phage major capsid protein
MKTLKEMQGRLNLVADKISDLYRKAERTADEESELDQLMAEWNDLGPQVERLMAAEKVAKSREAGKVSAGRVAGVEAYGAEEEDEQGGREKASAPRSLTERFYAESVQPFIEAGGLSKNGPERSAPLKLGRFQDGLKYEALGAEVIGPRERYTLIRSGGQPEYLIPPQVLPTIYRGEDPERTVRGVLINGRTTSDTIYFLRETSFTNSAAAVAEATAATGSSGLKPESALAFEQDSAPVVTVAHWVPITRQALSDAAQLQTYVEGRLMTGLEEVLNDQLLNGDGTGANMTGILAETGVQILDDTPTTGYFVTNPTANAGTDLENFDRIMAAATAVRTVGLARPSFLIVNPADLEVLLTTANSNGEYLGGGPFTSGIQRTIWGLPVVEETTMPAGQFLVGDGRMAAVWDREDANILVGTINDQLIRNMLTILAELRAALTVFRPSAFALGDFV